MDTRRRPDHRGAGLVVYLVVAFGWSWSWWLAMVPAGATSTPGQGWPTHLPGLLGPALGAVAAAATEGGTAALRALGRSLTRPPRDRLTWLMIAASLVLWSVAAAADQMAGRAGDVLVYSGAASASSLGGLLAVLGYVLVVNGIGEELGWRGYLADRLLDRHGLRRTATVVWVVWGLWHVPLFWVVSDFRAMSVATVVGWTIGLWCGSLALTWLYVRNERSTLVVAVWHTAYNLTTAASVGEGLPAALSTTGVVLLAAVLLVKASGPRVPGQPGRVRGPRSREPRS